MTKEELSELTKLNSLINTVERLVIYGANAPEKKTVVLHTLIEELGYLNLMDDLTEFARADLSHLCKDMVQGITTILRMELQALKIKFELS